MIDSSFYEEFDALFRKNCPDEILMDFGPEKVIEPLPEG